MKKRVLAWLTAALLLFSLPAWADYTEKTYIGSLAADFTAEERIGDTTLGVLAADAYLQACPKAVISLTLRQEYTGSLSAGALVWGDVQAVFSDDAPLVTAKVSATQLKAALEKCLECITLDAEGNAALGEGREMFFCTAGFSVKIALSAAVGSRVDSLKLDNGADVPLDNDYTPLTLAAHPATMALLFPEAETTPADVTPARAVADILDGQQQYAPRVTNRVTLAAEKPSIRVMMLIAGCASLLIIGLLVVVFRKNREKAGLH